MSEVKKRLVKLPLLNDCIISENSKNGWVYDIETYPNLFSVSFYNGRKHVQFEISKRKNEIDELHNFLNKPNLVLLGYNNYKFDDYVIGFLNKNLALIKTNTPDNICMLLARTATETIEYFTEGDKSLEENIKGLRKNNSFESIDLMKLHGIQKSLKLVAISLKWHNIQDLPYPFDKPLDESNMDEVLKYNRNDTEITFELLKKVRKEIELRYNLSILYNNRLLSESDSGISNVLFEKMYSEKTGVTDFSNLGTFRKSISLADCVYPNVEFKTPNLIDLLKNIKSTTLNSSNNFEFKMKKLLIAGKGYILGKGGLHSDDSPKKYEADKDVMIIDSDVTSYYPSIIINHNIKPDGLSNAFNDIMVNLTEERVKAKKEGDKIKADGLKIVINSTFGKLGFEGSFLYDLKAMFQVTINGQLYLLMLIEMLILEGFEVISANTDGIITLVPKNKEEKYYAICKQWEAKLNFTLEYTFYSKYVRRDVNNYLALTTDGKLKSKGVFYQDIDLRRGYDSPVIAYTLKAYFLDGINIDSFLKNHPDIYDFCISEKMGGQFKAEYDGKPIQKSVRYYVSTSGGKLKKYKIKNNEDVSEESEDGFNIKLDEKQVTDLVAGKTVMLFNQYEKKANYDIDYNFYIQLANKIIYEIIKSENVLF
jgi:hypothetical protein